MANIYRPSGQTPKPPWRQSHQPQRPLTPADRFGVAAMLGTLGGGIVLIFMAGWSGAGLLLIAILAFYVVARASKNDGDKVTFAQIIGFVSAATVIWAPLLLLATHVVPFTIAGWLADGLFIASLVWGVFEKLKGVDKAIAALLAASMTAYLVLMPSPKAFDDPDNEAAKWRVALSVSNEYGDPVSDALGLCTVFAPWEARPVAVDPAQARRSDAEGAFEPWSFTEDPKLKTVACFALKEAAEDNAGYPAQAAMTVGLARGITHPAKIELRENAHPDTAYLVVDARAETDSPWVQLSLELWDGRPTAGYGGTGYNFIERKGWNLDADGAFVLDARSANADLYVRTVYREQNDGAVKLFHIGPVTLGTRRRIILNVKNNP